MRSAASEHVIALDGIAVIVHPNNPTRALSRADVKRIFTGEVSEWSHAATREPGAPPGDRAVGSVNLYARDDASGTFDTFKHLVLGDRALATAKRFADSAALSDAVASDRVAIGFIGLAYVGNAKAIALSDVGTPATLPSAFTITTESYPLSRRLFFYTPAKPSHPAALRFVRFVLSDAGQKVVREAGFVDLGIELGGVEACTGKCPAGYLARTRGSRRLSVDFRFRDDTLDLDSRGVRDLDRLVAFLRDHSSGRLTLLGFSDDQGNPAATLAASRARANAVAAELTARGVRPAVVDGRGSEMPVAPNDDASGRERNRRVEVWLAER
jgi:phosphate transport system substrate-binding protein